MRVRRTSRGTRSRFFRFFLVGASIVALGAVIVFVEGLVPRLLLAAVSVVLLTGSAYSAGRASRARNEIPRGLPDRRSKHVLRHRVNEFVRSVRELDRIARGTSEGNVSSAAAEDAISDIYRSLDELTRQIRVLAGRKS